MLNKEIWPPPHPEVGAPGQLIETETVLTTNDRRIVSDIYVKSKRLTIEIETFYGTGLAPWRKLQKTIEKYVNSGEANEVWIVIPLYKPCST